jgi:hypothetical protein
MSTSQTTDTSHPTKLHETSTFDNVGPVPEKDPMMHSRNIDESQDINRNVNKDYQSQDLQGTTQSKGIIGSVMDAASSVAQRMRGALSNDNTNTSEAMERDRIDRTNENLRFEDDRTRTTGRQDTDVSGKSTTDKLKDTAYDTKEKVKDAAYDAKEKIKDTAHDIRNSSSDSNHDIKNKTKDTAHDIKNQAKDVGHDVKNQTKDVSHDLKNQTKDVSHDVKNKSTDFASDKDHSSSSSTYKKTDNSLSADSGIAADSTKQRLRDIKEKVMDAVQAPVVMAQTMYAASKDRLKESTSSDTGETTGQLQETPGTTDMFSQDYLPGASQVQTESKTGQAKSTLASTAANVADKAENWIDDNKHKLNQQADKAQDLAADVKHTANKKAQESGNEPATDTRYYSGAHGQTY